MEGGERGWVEWRGLGGWKGGVEGGGGGWKGGWKGVEGGERGWGVKGQKMVRSRTLGVGGGVRGVREGERG